MRTARLVLVRHGQSTWNADNRFTGWRDPGLSPHGEAQARRMGGEMGAQSMNFAVAFTSVLVRARRTCELILHEMAAEKVPLVADAALNERDYGELTGMDKDAARQKWGQEQVRLWRRGYHDQPPGGESLAQTAVRVVDYYSSSILPRLSDGNVLVVAHGNSLRALIMHLDELSPEAVDSVEIATGEAVYYRIDASGRVVGGRVVGRGEEG